MEGEKTKEVFVDALVIHYELRSGVKTT